MKNKNYDFNLNFTIFNYKFNYNISLLPIIITYILIPITHLNLKIN
jgi:hypothetical protein